MAWVFTLLQALLGLWLKPRDVTGEMLGAAEAKAETNKEAADAEARRAAANSAPRTRRTMSHRLRDGSA